MSSCKDCTTFDGCSRHRRYMCKGCRRIRPWSDGAADDMPDHCDDCWAAAHHKDDAE